MGVLAIKRSDVLKEQVLVQSDFIAAWDSMF